MSGERGAKDLLLEMDDGSGSYVLLGGLQAKTFTINAEEIDVTNHDSDQWKEILDGKGVRSMALSGNGVSKNAAILNKAQDNCINNLLTSFRIRDVSSGGRTFTATFKITSYEIGGEHNGAHTWSASMSSSGPVVVS
jgi:TP901-1 family phage major tail protein